MDDFEEFLDWVVEVDEVGPHRIPKRYVRDWNNPFECYSERQFKSRYRFSKDTVQNIILPLVNNELVLENKRGLPVEPMVQLLLNLRYYATGNFQTVTADLRGISQGTVCQSIKRVSRILAQHTADICKFDPDYNATIRKFHRISDFPNISCAIDGTHIPIKNPGEDIGEAFRNRKGIFSINVQVACGPNMQIVDIVARHPGSMRDNTIFERSRLRVKYENQEIPGKILGDNGYACKSYLLTPVINPTTRAERNYNASHKTTRNIIERCFGIWKRRFLCLKYGISTKKETAVLIICATAVLHNLRRHEDILEDDPGNDVNENQIEVIVEGNNVNALAMRRAFIMTHFN